VRRKTLIPAAASVAALVLSGLGAHAATVTGTFNTISIGDNLTLTLTNNYFSTPTTETTSFPVGLFSWTGTSSSNPASLTGAFTTFCIDFDQEVAYGANYTYTLSPLGLGPTPNGPGQGNPTGGLGASDGLGTDRTKETLIRQLWSEFEPTLGTDPDAYAAFQLSIWKIEYETQPSAYGSITTGDFMVSGSTTSGNYVTLADSYLAFLMDPANENAPQEQNLYAITSPTAQDQLVYVPSQPGGAIPEPAQFGLASPALLLLRRRRRG
jgi:hypothetical protein